MTDLVKMTHLEARRLKHYLPPEGSKDVNARIQTGKGATYEFATISKSFDWLNSASSRIPKITGLTITASDLTEVGSAKVGEITVHQAGDYVGLPGYTDVALDIDLLTPKKAPENCFLMFNVMGDIYYVLVQYDTSMHMDDVKRQAAERITKALSES